MVEPKWLKDHYLSAFVSMITKQLFLNPLLLKVYSATIFVESKPTHPFERLYLSWYFIAVSSKNEPQ